MAYLKTKPKRNRHKMRTATIETRATETARVACRNCDGHGFWTYEDPCTACAGDGSLIETVYAACGHVVDTEDCLNAGCTAGCVSCANEFFVGVETDEPEAGFICADCAMPIAA
jgi:RecJ-like exonuclease